MTGAELADKLCDLPPADVPAVRLLLELQAQADVGAAMARREEIESALDQLERQLEQVKGVVRRCQALPSVPSRRVPPGI